MADRKLPHMSTDVEGIGNLDSGRLRLEALGFKQELRRTMGFRSSFCASLSLMSSIMGITGASTRRNYILRETQRPPRDNGFLTSKRHWPPLSAH